jgi:hypothetical protein
VPVLPEDPQAAMASAPLRAARAIEKCRARIAAAVLRRRG